jgi:hypothetical protein
MVFAIISAKDLHVTVVSRRDSLDHVGVGARQNSLQPQNDRKTKSDAEGRNGGSAKLAL